MHIHFRLLFRRASEPSSSDRTAKQQIAYAQNSSIIQEIWNKIKVQFSSIRNKNQVQNACTEISGLAKEIEDFSGSLTVRLFLHRRPPKFAEIIAAHSADN